MNDTVRPIPGFTLRELRILKDATAAYIAVLQDFDQWAEQAADVNRLIRPDFAQKIDEIRANIGAALHPHHLGTVARIDRVVVELLGAA